MYHKSDYSMPKSGESRTRSYIYLLLAPVILFVLPVYYTCLRSEAFGLYHDDGLYLLGAQSLAQHGEYSIPSLPAVISQTKYPFLYPAVLAVLLFIAPRNQANLLFLKLPLVIAAVCWFVLICRLLARRYSPLLACTAVAFVMISHWCVFLTASLLPDILFSLLCLATVLCLDRLLRDGGDRYAVAASILAGSAFLVSTKGFTALLAGLAFLCLHRRWKHLTLFAAVSAGLCLPWVMWQRSIPVPKDPVLSYYSRVSYSEGHIFGNCSLTQAAGVVTRNVGWTATGFVDLIGVDVSPAQTVILAIGLSVLAAGGFWLSVRRGFAAADVWFALHTGMLVCWMWPPSRYLIPLFPLFLGYVCHAASKITWRWPGVLKPRVALISATVAGLVLGAATTYRIAQMTRMTNSLTLDLKGGPEDWPTIKSVCAWIASNTEPGAVVATNLDPVVFLLTGRKSIRAFNPDQYLLFYSERNSKPLGDAAGLRNHLLRHNVTHLLITPMIGYAEGPPFKALVSELSRSYPGSIRLAKIWTQTGAQIWRIDRAKLQAMGFRHAG